MKSVSQACKILNITCKCTVSQIQDRYRQLAKQYHPDLNKDIDLSKFIQINESYLILLQNAKHNNKEQNKCFPYPENGNDLYIQIVENDINQQSMIQYTIDCLCDSCKGNGSLSVNNPLLCQHCNSNGRINIKLIKQSIQCPMCDGTGYVFDKTQKCQQCNSSGYKKAIKSIIIDRKKIGVIQQYLHCGHQGKFGGINGNLYITIIKEI